MYELFDEMMDFGFPQVLFVSNPHTQITDTQVMKEYITQESQRLEKTTVVPSNLTNVVSWRQEGIKYKKNDVFLDVIEKVNLLVARDGTVLDSEIVGTIEMKVCLSGMPELKLGRRSVGAVSARPERQGAVRHGRSQAGGVEGRQQQQHRLGRRALPPVRPLGDVRQR